MADERAQLVELEDGGVLSVIELGPRSAYPLMLLHGGPGLDHHEFRPWVDPLAEQGFRLLFVDERGQGASPRVDPASLSIQVFAHDIDRLARALDLGAYAVLGHSFGAFIALSHALERGSADQYVISAGAASAEALMSDVEHQIEAFEPASMRDQIKRSWDEEPNLRTVEQARELSAAQMPFHFWEMGDAYSRYMQSDDTVYAPEVLAHFAANGYGGFEWTDHLRWITRPMLILAGRYDRACTVSQAEVIHREVEGSELVVIEKAAHMMHVEQPKAYMDAVRTWFIRQGVLPDPNAPAE
ncbi:MAG: alpha/beta fold hydrolase [Gaiellales bacterium]